VVILSLHDQDAVSLLTEIENIEYRHAAFPSDRMQRVADQLRCALALCECEKGDKT
jgi:hypothetical protein